MHEAIAKFAQKMKPFKRTAYVPVVSYDFSQSPLCSKIHGEAELENRDELPVLDGKTPHRLILQLNKADLPPEIAQNVSWDLLQFFYDEDDALKQWPNTSRVFMRKNPISMKERVIYPDDKPCAVITGWASMDDYPHMEDYAELGIELTPAEEALCSYVAYTGLIEKMKTDPAFAAEQYAWYARSATEHGMEPITSLDDVIAMSELHGPITGDKLGGWPVWGQAAEWPEGKISAAPFFQFCAFDLEADHRSKALSPNLFALDGFGHLWINKDHAPYFMWAGG